MLNNRFAVLYSGSDRSGVFEFLGLGKKKPPWLLIQSGLYH